MKEFRVSVLDQPGQLALVSAALSQKLVNIRTVAGIGSAGPVVTFITNDETQAREALDELGLAYQETEVISIKLSDEPGELAKLTYKLADADINIDSIYVLGTQDHQTEFALTVDHLEKAKEIIGL